MKSEGQIKQKLKQVIYRHRKNYVEQRMSRRPDNCAHQRRVSLPQHTGNRATIGVCYCEEFAEQSVCDSTMGGDLQAEECEHFKACNRADRLKDEFKRKLGLDGSVVNIGVIAKEYPDVAALMWALGPSKPVNKEDPEEPGDSGILAFFGGPIEEPEELPERPLVEDVDER